jgi:hypothetical protein
MTFFGNVRSIECGCGPSDLFEMVKVNHGTEESREGISTDDTFLTRVFQSRGPDLIWEEEKEPLRTAKTYCRLRLGDYQDCIRICEMMLTSAPAGRGLCEPEAETGSARVQQ